MSMTLWRSASMTIALSFAAGTVALAAITISPGASVTLHAPKGTRTAGSTDVTIVATSDGPKDVVLEATTCHQLTSVLGSVERGSKIVKTGTTTTYESHIKLRLGAKRSASGSCELKFSNGAETRVVHIEVVNPQ